MRLPSFPKKINERRPKGGAGKQQRDSATEPSTTSPTAESRAPTEIIDLILEHSDPAALSAAMEVSAKWRSSAQDPRMLQRKLQDFPGHKAISPRRPRPTGTDLDTNALVLDLKAKVAFESLVVQRKFKTIKVQPALDWFETTVRLSSEAKYLTLRRRHEFIEQGPDQPRAIDMRDWIYKEELWDVSKPSPKLIEFPDPNVNRHPRFTMRSTEPDGIMLSPDGKTAVVQRWANNTELWRISSNKKPSLLTWDGPSGRRSGADDLVFLPKSPYLLARDGDGERLVLIEHDKTGKRVRDFGEAKTDTRDPIDDSPIALRDSLSPDLKYLASGPSEGAITLHKIMSPDETEDIRLFLPNKDSSIQIASKTYLRGGDYFAGQSLERTSVYLWRLKAGEPTLHTLQGIGAFFDNRDRVFETKYLPILTAKDTSTDEAGFAAHLQGYLKPALPNEQPGIGPLELSIIDLDRTEAKVAVHHRVEAEGLETFKISPDDLFLVTHHRNVPFKLTDLTHPERPAVAITGKRMPYESLFFSPGGQYFIHQYGQGEKQNIAIGRPGDPTRPLLQLERTEVLGWTEMGRFCIVAAQDTHQVSVWSFQSKTPEKLYTLLDDGKAWKLAAGEQKGALAFFSASGETAIFTFGDAVANRQETRPAVSLFRLLGKK